MLDPAHLAALERDGFTVVEQLVSEDLRATLLPCIDAALAGRPGTRLGLAFPEIAALARLPRLTGIVENVCGPAAFPHRATLFDKSRTANWAVAWHQDLVVPVGGRFVDPAYGPWSRKGGTWFVQPPPALLAGLFAVRVDLDGSNEHNGALRVLPGSHRHGVLTPQRIDAFANEVAPVSVRCPRGGAVLLRPLLLHASSRAGTEGHRRVVHLEFCPAAFADVVRPCR